MIRTQNPEAVAHFYHSSSHGGGYADWPHQSRFVFVNIDTGDPYDIVQTVVHECAHKLPPEKALSNDGKSGYQWGFTSSNSDEGLHFPILNEAMTHRLQSGIFPVLPDPKLSRRHEVPVRKIALLEAVDKLLLEKGQRDSMYFFLRSDPEGFESALQSIGLSMTHLEKPDVVRGS